MLIEARTLPVGHVEARTVQSRQELSVVVLIEARILLFSHRVNRGKNLFSHVNRGKNFTVQSSLIEARTLPVGMLIVCC